MTATDTKVLEFAASELSRYVASITGSTPAVAILADRERPAIALGRAATAAHVDVPDVVDPRFDDAFAIEVEGDDGCIAGSNPRSVLIGTYRYLEEVGCRWLWPGSDGELIPKGRLPAQPIAIRDIPSYRHRALCIEGAVAKHHLARLIDFAPKLGFNGYFLQFWDGDGGLYAERWARSGETSREDGEALYAMARREMLQRGLVVHAGGHGWTSSVLGLPEFEEDGLREDDRQTLGLPPVTASAQSLPNDLRRLIALVGGRRDLWKDTPSNTNLCYSSADARRGFVAQVVDHLLRHRTIEVLHLWLADDFNNHCECRECARLLPADSYVRLLNEIDAGLEAEGLDTKLGCLAYLDLLWGPSTERVHNPDRFLLTFAPITRSYLRPFGAPSPSSRGPAYRRNDIELPETPEAHEDLLRTWQSACPGDSVTYEYHWYRNQYHDLGSLQTARVLHADIQSLEARGLNGYISCQSPRAAFPTGLGLTVLGKTLWNRKVEHNQLRDEYFAAAFGPDGGHVVRYLDRVGEALPRGYFAGDGADPARLRLAAAALHDLLGSFVPLVERNVREAVDNPVRRTAWSTIRCATNIHDQIAGIVTRRISGDVDGGMAAWRDLRTGILGASACEDGLDTFLLVRELDPILGGRNEPPKPRLQA